MAFYQRRAALFIRELAIRYFRHGVGKSSAALAYYFMFSLFPIIIFAGGLLSRPGVSELITTSDFAHIIPNDVMEFLDFLLEQSHVKSASMTAFGGFFSLYFPMRAVNSLMQSVNTAYGMQKQKPALIRYFTVFAFTIIFMVGMLGSLVLMVVGRSLLTLISEVLHISNPYIDTWNILRFFILAAAMFAELSFLYFIAPAKKLPVRYVAPGTAAALATWFVASIAFSFYVENMANYSVLYGSVGAVMVLMVWLYLTANVLIMGAEFNHALMVVDEYIGIVKQKR